VESESWSRRGKAVTALCFLLNMCDGVNIFTLTYVAPQLQREFASSAERFAVVFSAGLLGMALGGLGLAPLADRFGRRPLILLALALMSAAMVASACARGVWSLAAARVVVGIGIGTVLASITALSAGWDHACGLRPNQTVECWGPIGGPGSGAFKSVLAQAVRNADGFQRIEGGSARRFLGLRQHQLGVARGGRRDEISGG